jgi:hypothetical protein
MIPENPLIHFYPIVAASKEVRLVLQSGFGDDAKLIVFLLREGRESPAVNPHNPFGSSFRVS